MYEIGQLRIRKGRLLKALLASRLNICPTDTVFNQWTKWTLESASTMQSNGVKIILFLNDNELEGQKAPSNHYNSQTACKTQPNASKWTSYPIYRPQLARWFFRGLYSKRTSDHALSENISDNIVNHI